MKINVFITEQFFNDSRITSICGDYYIGGRQFASLEDLVAYYTEFSDLLPGEKLILPVPPEKVSNLPAGSAY